MFIRFLAIFLSFGLLSSCGLDDRGERFSFDRTTDSDSPQSGSNREPSPPDTPALSCHKSDFSYDESSLLKMDSLLARYVDQMGFVDYKAWLKEPRDLRQLCEVVASFSNTDLSILSYDEVFAFYVNAYNFATLDLVLRNYETTMGDERAPEPNVRSIRNIQDASGDPLGNDVWNVIRFDIAGENLSLNEIEHERLRKLEPVDARLHFAVNCASIGCPPLYDRAFRSKFLDSTLKELTHEFVNNGERNEFDAHSKLIRTSMILNWFTEDFEKDPKYNGIKHFLKAENDDSRTGVKSDELENYRIEFQNYDWRLNQSTE